ncbi:hypothetical protein MLD52_10120 [Puniceicoccaceae bacterium K14]|nr:hypothetical protein [Puniceicoccaceae bacterium K14]
MMKIPSSCYRFVTALFCLLSFTGSAIGAEGSQKSFGPYETITFNEEVLQDVKVDKEGNILLQLNPDFKDREIVVKISNQLFKNYREWWHGELELVSPAHNGKAANGWTDRVKTQANFIEYWMDGDIFLHLQLKLR